MVGPGDAGGSPAPRPSGPPGTDPAPLPDTDPADLPGADPAALPATDPAALPATDPAPLPATDPAHAGLFVTGTDTGVGKTVLAAAILAALRAAGRAVVASKPLITGLGDPAARPWPHDHELLAAAAGARPEQVIVRGFGPAVSPHLAAELAGGDPPTVAAVARAVQAAARADAVLVVEGVGGLLVPIGPDGDVRALARALGLPLVIAARPGLGTINHTLLTLEAARRAGLAVAAVVLTPWPAAPGLVERSNRETIARLGAVAVEVLPWIAAPELGALAAAGAALPVERWLATPPATPPGSEPPRPRRDYSS